MTAEAIFLRREEDYRKVAAAAIAAGEVHQLASGHASVYVGLKDAASGDRTNWTTEGQFTVAKTTGMVFLDGGRVYWDKSANKAHYKKVNDGDFYLGRCVGDAASTDTTCVVNLNADPPYDLDLARDPFTTAIVLTAGTPTLNRRGGAQNIKLDSTNEAQKVDALGKDGFATAANAIVEMAFNVVNDGAGAAVDVSLGIASATHATDADSIAKHLFVHLDANNVNINLQSKDGTTTVAATDTTIDYTEGAGNANRVEVWFDMRDPADVQVYVNGSLVLPATVFDVSASASTWFLLAHVEKTAAADVYEIDVDWMRARFAEQ